MIEKETLGQIILDFQKQDLPELVNRDLKVNLEIPLKRAITILGPRRSGKTYYLYSLIKQLLKNNIEKKQILYVNFEDTRMAGASLEDLTNLLETFFEIYPETKKQKTWLFFDEIQNAVNWEVFVRNVLDQGRSYVFLSGSSSKLLSKEVATSLRGRTLSYLLLPFSFSEFLKAKNIIYKKYLSSDEKAVLVNDFNQYFINGGYPETIIYPKEHLRIIVEMAIGC